MKWLLLFFSLLSQTLAERKVEVFVCLCDNEHQAIAKVGARIGNGMDPAGNLYWGCSDGLSSYFKRSKKWKLLSTEKHEEGPILITLTFKHYTGKATLVAHAYRGDEMKVCLETYFQKALTGGKDELVTFIGHNGMMDNIVTIPKAAKPDDVASETIVLGCLTGSYFTKPLKAINSKPLLMTKSLMYPGSFLLHDALEVWLRDGSKKEIREAAAKAYAKNQNISVRSARTVFSDLK